MVNIWQFDLFLQAYSLLVYTQQKASISNVQKVLFVALSGIIKPVINFAKCEKGAIYIYMLRLALCDDNPKFLAMLKELTTMISKEINRELEFDICCFSDGKELIDTLTQDNLYDVILLDWDMPGLNGEKTGEMIRKLDKDCLIIFITAFYDYAIQASKLTSFRYITKDMLNTDLPEALQAAYDKQIFNEITIQIKETHGSHHLIRIKEIVSIEGQVRKTTVHLKLNKTIIAPRSFLIDHSGFFLQNNFIRPYRGILINAREIARLNQNEIIMTNGHKVPMSRKYKQDVFVHVQKFMEFSV